MSERARFELVETEAGNFSVVEMQPVEVAFFYDRDLAETAVAALNGEIVGAVASAPVVEDKANEAPPASPPAPVSPPPAPVVEEAAPKPVFDIPAKKYEPASEDEVDPNAWNELELSLAFQHIEKGRPLKVVAEEVGKSWTVLRAKWAQHQKAIKDAGGEEVLDDEQERCTTCNRAFVPSAERPDQCARCANV